MIGGSDTDVLSINTSGIREWRAIVTLVVFVLTSKSDPSGYRCETPQSTVLNYVNVLYSYHIPILIPAAWCNVIRDASAQLRITEPRPELKSASSPGSPEKATPEHAPALGPGAATTAFAKRRIELETFRFPMNFVTAPLIADLFLLAIGAIGGKEVRQGTLGANNISPLDVMLFFITLAYIAISIDASGLIRYLAFKVLRWGGKTGRRLFLYLYILFFGLTTFIGNDPVILSGTAFLAYMTRASKGMPPRAWIFTQFAAANIGSAILVSSNPTNLVLAGAFNIKFIHYTANMVFPTVITAVVLFPVLLYVVFNDPKLIPRHIEIHELPSNLRELQPINPNIPSARASLPTPRAEEGHSEVSDTVNSQEDLLALEEVLNPFLDLKSAIFGSVVMATTLITLLALNAASKSTGEHPVFWVTLPAAFVMFCWDVGFGWCHRNETRQIARHGDERRRRAIAGQPTDGGENAPESSSEVGFPMEEIPTPTPVHGGNREGEASAMNRETMSNSRRTSLQTSPSTAEDRDLPGTPGTEIRREGAPSLEKPDGPSDQLQNSAMPQNAPAADAPSVEHRARGPPIHHRATLVGRSRQLSRWLRETFPTTMAVLSHLPFALVPFAFAMFVLVQALVSKHWVATFAYGWKHWVDKTGVVGGIAGMGFLSVVLCNFAGTNIGTTILLSRIVQTWQEIHRAGGSQIDDRTFWATVYSMAIGVNYGAFSAAFSASLAGLLWRNILERKDIRVGNVEFARVNLPIISVAMIVGLTVLVVQVYVTTDGTVN